jgi:alpha-L-fucosidase
MKLASAKYHTYVILFCTTALLTLGGDHIMADNEKTIEMLGLIPQPASVDLSNGTFTLPAESVHAVQQSLPKTTAGITFKKEKLQAESDEAYRLNITPSGVEISATTDKGMFYAWQTLRQLIPVKAAGATAVPCVEIEDAPRFQWRGLMLDVGRYYMPVEFIKEFIDLLAMHKLNTFHWHLTEDQGWRIEIKKYPKLSTVAATRAESPVYGDRNKGDGTPYGPFFYTQDEIREIVAYAAERHVTVVPEIELPGHSLAALAAYPELGCTGGPYQPRTRWGVEDDVYCAGSEKVFAFLEDVLTEVLELFPSEFIHIGADECPKARWKTCPKCQARIKDEGLYDEHELQGYFVTRMENFLNAKGRRLIGWDEILEGGLAPNAAVMSWRGVEGGIAAARQRHDVVMSPTSHCYFDYYPGKGPHEPESIGGHLPLERVYSYNPVPPELTAEEAKHVMGVQGNLWTEYMWTPEDVEYKAFPRACALAEVAWLPAQKKDWYGFRKRLETHVERLDRLDVDYRPLDRPVETATDVVTNLIAVTGDDTPATIIEKAAHVVPTPRQLDYHRREYIAFIHWGPNAFSRREWGTGKEDSALFAPPAADTDQWCRAMKAAGMRLVVLTAKHHDGYCLWQTRYTSHSIAGSPWEDGKGDVLRNLSTSCEKYGLKLGVYLSPADLYQIESPDGLYGNGSAYTERTIPRPVEDRPFEDERTFNFKVDDYNEYFLNQLFELLTEYGPVHEVWFDGAHPKRKGEQTYTYSYWDELIRTLAPEAVIFGKGPDVRWCGNEAGNTRDTEWNVIPLATHPDQCDWPDLCAGDLGSREKLADANYLYYLPPEIDTSIRHGWFYRDDDDQRVRPAAEVFDIYERAVGGNGVFMLNIPPNREGKFSERDVASLLASGERIRRTYGRDLAADAKSATPAVLDDDPASYWQADGLQDELRVRFPELRRVNRFVVQEEISGHGQRIEEHALDAWIGNAWAEVARGTTVGYKKILRFEAVETQRLRFRILASRAAPAITKVSVHYADPAPVVKEKILLTVPTAEWNVHAVSSVHSTQWGAEKAFDGKPDTFWHTSWDNPVPPHPHHIAIDMGTEYAIKGFSYLPRQDGTRCDSMIEDWRFEISQDGKTWTTAKQGAFGNIFNDPSRRIEHLEKTLKCRYVRLVSLTAAEGLAYAGAAEIQILADD